MHPGPIARDWMEWRGDPKLKPDPPEHARINAEWLAERRELAQSQANAGASVTVDIPPQHEEDESSSDQGGETSNTSGTGSSSSSEDDDDGSDDSTSSSSSSADPELKPLITSGLIGGLGGIDGAGFRAASGKTSIIGTSGALMSTSLSASSRRSHGTRPSVMSLQAPPPSVHSHSHSHSHGGGAGAGAGASAGQGIGRLDRLLRNPAFRDVDLNALAGGEVLRITPSTGKCVCFSHVFFDMFFKYFFC